MHPLTVMVLGFSRAGGGTGRRIAVTELEACALYEKVFCVRKLTFELKARMPARRVPSASCSYVSRSCTEIFS